MFPISWWCFMGTISISPTDGQEKYCRRTAFFIKNIEVLQHNIKAKESDTLSNSFAFILLGNRFGCEKFLSVEIAFYIPEGHGVVVGFLEALE